MNYIPPFAVVRNVLIAIKSARGKATTGLDEDFLSALRLLLAGVNVDDN
jgi:hypothetical protein